ncbi:MAG TPA: putative zinc-binding peptidase [Solirubrobacteraceae bacterium]|nr:putative zinc-binding peptidase [Solirubrobacteraceae bacterium]
MRAFTCGVCGQLLFFENSRCLRCSSRLGFVPSRLDIVVLDDGAHAHPGASTLRPCANQELAQCNWVLEEGDPGPLCVSCRLTRTRPADDDPEDLAAFAKAEGAKRRLIFQLLDLGLAIGDDLAFDLLSSRTGSVVTGHNDGVITIDLAESDDARRARRRAELGEPYRTMLGHFRHEIGHYYWPILVEHTDGLERARALFGDDRVEYDAALQRHYEQGPPSDWSERYVSAYATMHPWENWAETFAHYLHIRDTLETAAEFGLVVAGPVAAHDDSLSSVPVAEAAGLPFDAIVADWLPLTYALNAINRSMGYEDLYPFTLAPAVIEKLAFVHDRVRAAARPPRVPVRR